LSSPEVRASIHLHLAEADIRRRSRGGRGGDTRIGIVGGGQMGSGIAATAVTRGLSAIVRDVDEENSGRAGAYLDRVLKRSQAAEPTEVRQRWTGTTSWEGLADVDAVVEAVFELPELKKVVLRDISG